MKFPTGYCKKNLETGPSGQVFPPKVSVRIDQNYHWGEYGQGCQQKTKSNPKRSWPGTELLMAKDTQLAPILVYLPGRAGLSPHSQLTLGMGVILRKAGDVVGSWKKAAVPRTSPERGRSCCLQLDLLPGSWQTTKSPLFLSSRFKWSEQRPMTSLRDPSQSPRAGKQRLPLAKENVTEKGR